MLKWLKKVGMWMGLTDQKGAVDLSNILMLGIGMLFMGIGAYMIAPMIEGFEDARMATNVSEYTALASVIQIGPTLITLGFIIAGAVVGFLGIRGIASKK